MKAAILKAYGDIDQFEIADIAVPTPGPGEVLLKIEASAVNPFDLILRQGFMAQYIPLPFPAILGSDAAGTIAAVGEGVTGFAVGDRVAADFAHNGKAAHAEFGVVATTSVAKLPAALSFEQGAALVKAGLTGRQTVEVLGVKAGDRVLVSGGLGTVGRSAIQYIKQLGAHPVAGVRPERLSEGREVAGEALDITSIPADPTFDYAISTAGPVAGNLFRNVRDGGTVASIVPVPDDSREEGRITIHELYHRTDVAMLDAILASAVDGALIIPISDVFVLGQIGEAHATVAKGARGKVVVKH